ncbi:MAG TPA: ABC transporter permease subunit, partial [Gammaproteobacteria bacterium]|nr:ABC transporter permease subunit [Gammaproteobacteria bacterium]
MAKDQQYAQPKRRSLIPLNLWDLIIIILFFGLMACIVWGAQQMSGPYQLGEQIPIRTNPIMLPSYALYTVIRMAIALCFSIFVTFTMGTLAAKSKRAERIILPFIDIMQSVPILGFLSISLLAFIYLFPGSRLGPECAAILAIFTSQVWNMVLSFYQSVKTLPKDLKETAAVYHLSGWQKFWRMEVPFAMPSLLWNTMASLSAGWFFVVASEAISVANQHITLPGIGSYIMLAQEQANYSALFYVIITMLIVILLYDQLIFRPLLVWSEKFKAEPSEEVESAGSWFLDLLQRAHISKLITDVLYKMRELLITPKRAPKVHTPWSPKVYTVVSWTAVTFWNTLIGLGLIGSVYLLVRYIYQDVTWQEVVHVFYLGFITTVKVTILIILSSLIWVPVGVWIGLKPKLASFIQPIVQFIAAFPANLIYPILFMLILTYNLNVDIWTSPLMILGTQWYILFNVIAGTLNIPLELRWAAKNYQVRG